MATNNSINTPLITPVPRGGSGLASVTQYAGLAGNGTSALTVLGVLGDGEFYIGATGGAMAPATITQGPNIIVTPSANGLTIEAVPASFPYTEETGTSATMAGDNGYIANNAALVTLTLPATMAVGDEFIVTGKGAGGWLIAQNSGQTIYYGTSTTTTGVGGSLSSTQQRDGIHLVCITADTELNVLNAQGNITVT